jgi:hypothetical protein
VRDCTQWPWNRLIFGLVHRPVFTEEFLLFFSSAGGFSAILYVHNNTVSAFGLQEGHNNTLCAQEYCMCIRFAGRTQQYSMCTRIVPIESCFT